MSCRWPARRETWVSLAVVTALAGCAVYPPVEGAATVVAFRADGRETTETAPIQFGGIIGCDGVESVEMGLGPSDGGAWILINGIGEQSRFAPPFLGTTEIQTIKRLNRFVSQKPEFETRPTPEGVRVEVSTSVVKPPSPFGEPFEADEIVHYVVRATIIAEPVAARGGYIGDGSTRCPRGAR